MRVTVTTIDDFCSELTAEAANIADRIVRTRVDITPQQSEGISFDIGLWATALVNVADGGQYVLEFGEPSGVDDGGDESGSKLAREWIGEIRAVCEQYGLQMRRGKIEVF